MLRNNLAILSTIFIISCTQAPSRVEMRGGQSFAKGVQTNPNYSSSTVVSSGYKDASPNYSAPISQSTVNRSPSSSIGVNDLPPPSSTNLQKMEQNTTKNSDNPFAKSSTDKDKTTTNPPLKTTVNPWTNKPRSSDQLQSKSDRENIEVALKTVAPSEEDKDFSEKSEASSELKWPVSSKKVISTFGKKGAGKANDGINIAADDGSPVWAAADGQVVFVNNDERGMGNMVLIKHSGGRTTTYAHLSRITVDKYDRVTKGDTIGYVGSTGNVKTPQLFFSLHKGKEAVDPQK